MEATTRPRVKICCIANREEAWMAIRAGASALGLVSAMPSGPGVIDDVTIAEVAGAVPPSVSTFLLTSLREASTIAEQQRRLRTTTVQICDRITLGAHAELRRALPGIGLVQVVHVTGPESLEEAVRASREVDALLLDSGNPSLAVKELGGTGRRHDWRISRQIREAVAVPIFLAGGLSARNVGEAVTEVGAFGLDVCSGVRTDGRLDPHKLEAFFAAIRTTRA
jgi:phosphoribosylanthranilate isomerase